MNRLKDSSGFFLYLLPICITTAVLLTSLLAKTTKEDILNDFEGMMFIVESNTDFDATLYYTYSADFDAIHLLKNEGKGKDTLLFSFPKSAQIVKKFRLDLGNDPKLKEVKIKALQLLFNDKITVLNQQQVFDNLFLNSASATLNKDDRSILVKSDVKPFDPYIIFSPLGALDRQGPKFMIVLLLPFIVLMMCYFIKTFDKDKITLLDFLMLLFIICIPLKIAWTTFCTILLCAYGLVDAGQKKGLRPRNWAFYFYLAIFLTLIVLGRPSNLSSINKPLALLLFAILSITIDPPIRKTYRHYVKLVLIFNAIIIASGLNFLIWFKDFYGLGVLDYFKEIKLYSGTVRDWLYYDHAAFLSYFGLVGLLFLHKLYAWGDLDKKFLYLYHILLVLTIVFLGARICLLIYIVFLFNQLVKLGPKNRFATNFIVFGAVASTLIYNIRAIDYNRYKLWSISWEAIMEKPLFGYGLGQSNDVLHHPRFVQGKLLVGDFDLNHSHNQFVTFLLELGIVGSLMLIALLAIFLYKTKFYRSSSLTMFLFGLGYIFLTESILQTSKPLYVICFLFLLITMEAERDKREASQIDLQK